MQKNPRQQRRPARSAEVWRQTIADWRHSGLAGRAYAERHGLAASSLYKWATRLRDAQQHVASDEAQQLAPRFVAVEAAPMKQVQNAECTLELEWPSGAVMRYRGGVSADALAVVVRTLAEVTPC